MNSKYVINFIAQEEHFNWKENRFFGDKSASHKAHKKATNNL